MLDTAAPLLRFRYKRGGAVQKEKGCDGFRIGVNRKHYVVSQ